MLAAYKFFIKKKLAKVKLFWIFFTEDWALKTDC